MDFSYILKKIADAPVLDFPFRHIQLNDLFSSEHFKQITQSVDIKLPLCNSDSELFEQLFNSNYKIVKFPGCTVDMKEYIDWHKSKANTQKTNTACEGFGMVLRLTSPESDEIQSLQTFLMSKEFVDCISAKFEVNNNECNYDAGIQKYLDGYEISPHPDVRLKALTYMVNINSCPNSEINDHHTSYLQFKSEFDYVRKFWEGNLKYDRCWVPWQWCDIKKQQTENNSMVIFSPSNNTIHAVKANYDHLNHQRTQLYGNLWYKSSVAESMPNWEKLQLPLNSEALGNDYGIFKTLRWDAQKKLESFFSKKSDKTHTDRKY